MCDAVASIWVNFRIMKREDIKKRNHIHRERTHTHIYTEPIKAINMYHFNRMMWLNSCILNGIRNELPFYFELDQCFYRKLLLLYFC